MPFKLASMTSGTSPFISAKIAELGLMLSDPIAVPVANVPFPFPLYILLG